MKLLFAMFILFTLPSFAQTATITGGGGASTVGPAPKSYYEAPLPQPGDLQMLMQATPPAILLRVDDVISISVFGVPAYSSNAHIAKDGTIKLPLMGPIEVVGLTIEQAESIIADKLSDAGLVIDPSVTATASELTERTVVVSGEVAKPGSFPTLGSHTVTEFLARAGDFLPSASTTLTLLRPGKTAIALPLSPNPLLGDYSSVPIFAGDEIIVSRIGSYYVVGAVHLQGVYPLKSTTPTTVGQALAIVGGVGYEALLDDAKIVRTSGISRVMLSVHAGKIMRGREADVPLQNDDILFIPTSALKASIKGGGTGIIVGLATAYIYSHP